MQFAITAQYAMAGDDDGYRVGGVGAPHGPHRFGFADLGSHIGIAEVFAIGNSVDGPQRRLLEGRHHRPVEGQVKLAALLVEVFG